MDLVLDEKSICKVPFIAVIGPFRGENHWEVYKKINKAEQLHYQVFENGFYSFCPHNNTRHFEGSLSDDIWLGYCQAFIEKFADGVILVDGWENSSGTKAEIELCKELNIPIFYSINELVTYDWESHGYIRSCNI